MSLSSRTFETSPAMASLRIIRFGFSGWPSRCLGHHIGTIPTLDTGRPGPVKHMLQGNLRLPCNGTVLRKYQNSGSRLCHHRIFSFLHGHPGAHHRPAGYNKIPGFFCTARKGNTCFKGSSHRNMKDRRIPDFPGHGQIFFRKGFPFHGVADTKHRCHIGNNAAHIQRYSCRRNHPAL